MAVTEKSNNMDFNTPQNISPSLDFSKITNHLPRVPETLFQSPIMNQTPKSVLILGNGFDLDLGLKTSYKDFVKSSYWPFGKPGNYRMESLPWFLDCHLGAIGTWYDLEEILAKFASQRGRPTSELIDKDKASFKELIQSLKEYLQSQEDSFIKGENTDLVTPASFIMSLFLQKENHSIYSFNYTNVCRIFSKINSCFEKVCTCTHVHGSLAHGNIILGAGDQRELNDNYFEFYKSASPHYESNNLVEDLNSADEVYIFGHSLGLNDHDYFSDFFKMASRGAHIPFPSRKTKIRIFTLDDQSAMDIKKQLMILTERHLTGLYAHSDFEILKTYNSCQADWMNSKYKL